MSKRFSLGRADARKADILLSGSTISAKHAELYIDNNGMMFISDMGSSNGTIIHRNGQKINVSSQSVSLVSSDILSLGGKKFTIAELLEKSPKGGGIQRDIVRTPKPRSSGKMMRCSSCGSVTPKGKSCVECGH